MKTLVLILLLVSIASCGQKKTSVLVQNQSVKINKQAVDSMIYYLKDEGDITIDSLIFTENGFTARVYSNYKGKLYYHHLNYTKTGLDSLLVHLKEFLNHCSEEQFAEWALVYERHEMVKHWWWEAVRPTIK